MANVSPAIMITHRWLIVFVAVRTLFHEDYWK